MVKRNRYILIACSIVFAFVLLPLAGWKIISDSHALQTEKKKVTSLSAKITALKDDKELGMERKKTASLNAQVANLENQLKLAHESSSVEAPLYPATPEDVIREYYKAVNAKNYGTAWTYGIPGNNWFNLIDNLAISYADYVSTVEVTDVTALSGAGQTDTHKPFSVKFNAAYIKPYPAGNGKLPSAIWVDKDNDGKWKIQGIGTGI